MAAMALLVAIASLFVFPWLTGSSFGPSHRKGQVDFSALRASAQQAARNDNKHLRDADRDDGKAGSPPDASSFILTASVYPICTKRADGVAQRAFASIHPSCSRGSQQPRAPPAYPA
jgi:hypothetical protein